MRDEAIWDNLKFTLFCLDEADQNDMIRKEFYIAE